MIERIRAEEVARFILGLAVCVMVCGAMIAVVYVMTKAMEALS